MEADSSVPQVVAVEPAEQAAAVLARAPAEEKSAIVDFAQSLLVTILLALFGTTFVVQAFKIPSQSMEPTLLVGDHLLVNKFLFEGTGAWYDKLLPYREIRRGDIVVFKFPYDDHPYYVKRVIGLPGDQIRIVNEQVYVNGVKLNEPYIVHDPSAEDPIADNFPPTDRYYLDVGLRPEWAGHIMSYVRHDELLVPKNEYFVMGDNRDRSWDSRYWGFVERNAIVGQPALIYWSVDATADDYADRSLWGGLRGIEQSIVHISSRTRWHRMLREVH